MNRIPDRPGIKGHSLMAVERFADDTRHMAEFDVLSRKSPLGERGDAVRLFFSDEGYAQVLTAEKRGDIRIRRHARVIEGHILPEKPSNRRHGRR